MVFGTKKHRKVAYFNLFTYKYCFLSFFPYTHTFLPTFPSTPHQKCQLFWTLPSGWKWSSITSYQKYQEISTLLNSNWSKDKSSYFRREIGFFQFLQKIFNFQFGGKSKKELHTFLFLIMTWARSWTILWKSLANQKSLIFLNKDLAMINWLKRLPTLI